MSQKEKRDITSLYTVKAERVMKENEGKYLKYRKEYGNTFSNSRFTFKGLHGFISQNRELFESKY
jgi:hypothetical protein